MFSTIRPGIKNNGLTKRSKEQLKSLKTFDKELPKQLQRITQKARKDVLKSQLFTGKVLTKGNRPQGIKDSAYNRLFGYSVKPMQKTQSIRATLGFKKTDDSGDFIKSGSGTYLNKLTSTTSYKANSDTSIRIASEKSGEYGSGYLTTRGRRLRRVIKKSKNILVVNPSKVSKTKRGKERFSKNKKWKDINAVMIFRRRRIDNTLIPLGMVHNQGTYKGKNYKGYKLSEIQRIGNKYLGKNGMFDKWLQTEFNKLHKK